MSAFMATFTHCAHSGLSEFEIAAHLGRLVEMLSVFERFWLRPPRPRPAQLQRALHAFGMAPCGAVRCPPLGVGAWCTTRRKEMEDWARSGLGGATPALRARMAELLWALGEAHFPQGVRSVPAGARAWQPALGALTWWRQLPEAQAHAALSHAEDVLAPRDPATGLRSAVQLGKHDAHAALCGALLASPPFQQHAAALTSPRALDAWQHAAATRPGAAPLRIEAGPGAGKTRTITARCVHTMASVTAAAAARGALPLLRAEDVVAVTFTRRAAAALQEKLRDMRVPCPAVSTMDSFMLGLVADVRRRAHLPPLTWLPTKRAERETARTAKEKEGDVEAAAALREGRSCEETLLRLLRGGAAAAAHNSTICTDGTAKALAPAVTALLGSMMRAYRAHDVFSWAPPGAAAVAAVADDITREWASKTRNLLARATPPLYTLPREGRDCEGAVQAAHLRLLLNGFAAAMAAHGAAVASFAFDKELLALALLAPSPRAAAPLPAWVRSRATRAGAAAVRALASRAHYVIDEFQDTSPAQLRVFAALAVAAGAEPACVSRLTAVGDRDQSVYAFRGTCSAALDAAFREACPGAGEPLPLLLNYRSTPHIVAACAALIRLNYRPPCAPKALKARRAHGLPVRLVRCASAEDEHAHVLAALRAWRAAGVPLHHMAVLFRQRTLASGMDAFVERMHGHNFRTYTLMETKDSASAAGGDADDAAAATPRAAAVHAHVSVGTIHAAKGLEWRLVFVVGACAAAASNLEQAAQRAAPHVVRGGAGGAACSAALAELACEERRVAYVALSRARELLHVTYAANADVAFVEDLLRDAPPGSLCHVALRAGDEGREHAELAADVAGLQHGAEEEEAALGGGGADEVTP
jgi:superfamily I DNA/RNA helicase